MKKSLLFLAALVFFAATGWGQPIPGNPVITINPAATTPDEETVEVNVTASDFTDVGSLSLTLTYNSAALQNPTIVFLHPDLITWGTFEANLALADTITVSAMDPNLVEPYDGITLEDGDIIFTIQFEIGTITDFTSVAFYENSEGTSCEITGSAPTYPIFTDTPMDDYYIDGVVEMIDMDPGSIGSDQYICDGDDAAALTSQEDASGEGTITYVWQKSTTSGSENFLDIEGETGTTYDPGTLTADTWFRRVSFAELYSQTRTEYSNAIKITVINFDGGSISGNQTICEGDDIAELPGDAATGDGTITYQWQISTTGSTEGFSNIEGATTASYDPGTASVDTWFRRITTATMGGKSCSQTSDPVTVVVNNFVPGTVAGSQVICEGSDPDALTSTVEASGDGTLAYQWEISTTGESGSYSAIDGATAAGFDPGTLTVDTWFRRKATSVVNGVTCTEYANVLSVNVNSLDPGTIGPAQYIAEGADPAALNAGAEAVADGTLSYQWQASTISASEGFANIEGATSAVFDPSNLTADTWYRRMATSTIGENACTEYSNTIAVTVINFEPGAISEDEVYCQGDDVVELSNVTAASGDGTITYQWQSSVTGESEGFGDIDGATSASYNPGNATTDTWYRREAIASLGGTELSEYTNVVYIAVIGLTEGSIGNPQTICSGLDPLALTNVESAVGENGIAYQWQLSTTGSSEGFSDIENATADTYDPGVLTVDTWFRRKATTSLNGTECVKYTNAVKITVNQRRTISGTFYYYHSGGNIPMTGQNINVNLYLKSDEAHENLLATDVTDASGYYEFTNLCPDCDYDVVASTAAPTTGAINTTDAAHVNYWGAHNSTIEMVKFYSGDVGTSGQCQDLTINSTDAGRIQQRFVYGYPFDRPWTFWKAGTTISTNPACESFPWTNLPVGSDVTMNMYALVTGDFNRSFNPVMTKSAASTLSLIYKGNRQITHEQEFELPVRITEASTVGAISLILNIPSELVIVRDVFIKGVESPVDWSLDGNELRIGWNGLNPLYLQPDGEMIILKLQAVSGFKATDAVTISLTPDPLNELADANFEVIGNAVLAVETINGNALGVTEPTDDSGLFFSNYPNPFGNSTRISYTLPAGGHVMISISNFTGSRLMTLAEEYQTAGNYELTLDSPDMPTGVYIATISFRTGTNIVMKTHKIIKR
ncbi:MAG: T9SS type A sorting domain-containing protein [Bacteroidales bacterium]|jgi:hypothetical protein|nr:T9SS type A sorting domain-containing protein [Bacteroidales bacterium]